MSEQAKRAYDGYVKSVGLQRSVGWDDLPEESREAWRAAIVAAIDSPPKQETMTDVQVRLLDEMGTAALARKIKAMMPPGRGFLLFTADYGPGGQGSIAYCATVERDDAVRLVREWLAHQGAL